MNMHEAEFGEMRIGTFFLKLRFFSKQREEELRERVEIARLQTFHLVNIQLQEKDRLKHPGDFWPLPWDSRPAGGIKVTSDEEAAAQLERLLKAHEKWQKD